MELLRRLRQIIWREDEEPTEERCIARIEIRLPPDEKILFKEMAKYQNITLSKLVRESTMNYINDFVKVRD